MHLAVGFRSVRILGISAQRGGRCDFRHPPRCNHLEHFDEPAYAPRSLLSSGFRINVRSPAHHFPNLHKLTLSSACVATIVRIPYVPTLDHYKGDFLWNTWQVAVLSTVEVGLGITAACTATFRPLVQTWLGTSRSGTHSASGARKSKTKMTGFAGIKSHTVVTQTKGVMMRDLDGLDKALAGHGTIVTTITGRESFTHLPDLVMMEPGEELDEESLVSKDDRAHGDERV